MVDVLIDSFAPSPTVAESSIYKQFPSIDSYTAAVGESFKLTTGNFTASYVIFRLKRTSLSPVGTLRVYIYESIGTFGINAKPFGDAIGYSTTTIEASDLTTSLAPYTFIFGNKIVLLNNHVYCIVIQFENVTVGDSSHYIRIEVKTTGGHAGNGLQHKYAGWLAPISGQADMDVGFLLYGASYILPRKGYIQTFEAMGKDGKGYKQSIEGTENEDLSELCRSLPNEDSYTQTFGEEEY